MEKQLVLKIRRENPTYGKEKITVILKRDHDQSLSVSTVGRILTHLKEKGLVTKSPSALHTKCKHSFTKHAKPWTYKNYKDMTLGERVQIDHMTVTKMVSQLSISKPRNENQSTFLQGFSAMPKPQPQKNFSLILSSKRLFLFYRFKSMGGIGVYG